MIGLFQTIAQAFWFILPAYFANAAPVIGGGGTPVDGGRTLSDGNRILGDGKTIRGTLFGLLVGSGVGLLQIFFWDNLGFFGAYPEFHSIVSKTIVWTQPQWTWKLPVLLSLGALLGDMVASFIKRRWGLESGESVPGLDQLEFIIGALLLASVFWTPPLEIIVTLLVLTPLIHLGLNFIGYKMGFKSEPY